MERIRETLNRVCTDFPDLLIDVDRSRKSSEEM